MNIYGYARISTNKQNIERQNRNILELYPQAKIINEVYTGTTSDRKEWQKLVANVKANDTIVFDSVSRMSRNAQEGIDTYMALFNKGVNLVFIKEPHINTDVYKQGLSVDLKVKSKDRLVTRSIEFVEDVLRVIATQQIELAFQQSQKEVDDLRQRTKEGIVTAKAQGKVCGRPTGSKIETAKAKDNKAKILKLSKSFNGTLSDKEVLELLDIDRTTYYRYKKQLKEMK